MAAPRGRTPIYPWAMWFGWHGPRLLHPGIDFDSSVNLKSLRAQITTRARRDGVPIRTWIYGTGIGYEVLAHSVKQDYDVLLDGEVHKLIRDEDFKGEVVGMQKALLREAHRRGIRKLDLSFINEHNALYVRAHLPEADGVITSEPSDDLEVNHA